MHHNLLPRHQVYAIPTAALASFHNLTTIAEHYPLVTEPPEAGHEQRVIYFDTADYRLLRSGLAAYVEQDRDQLCLTVENWVADLPDVVDKQSRRRQPVTEVIPDLSVAAALKVWPKVLRKAVASTLSRHTKLQPILVSRRQRLVRTITIPSATGKADSTNNALATVTLDNITVGAPADGANPADTWATECPVVALGQLCVTFVPPGLAEVVASSELEEMVDRQDHITTWLAAQPSLQPITNRHQQLLEQGLLMISGYVPGTMAVANIQPEMFIADSCQLIWRKQFMTMLLQEAGARYTQEREYVHEMRIAIRRMRAAAKLYGHFWPRKAIRLYLAALRKTGRLLGHIRNLDVTLAKARRTQNQNGEKVRAPKKLLKTWRQERQAAQQKLLYWLDSHEYNNFVAEFQHFCTTSAHHSKHDDAPIPQQVRHVIPAQIWQGFAAVRCYETLFVADLPIDYPILHNLRIACKYLRYNLEFVRHLLGPESETLITRLKGLQELLGDLNDAVIAQSLADETRQSDDIASYQAAQSQQIAELSAQVPDALAVLVSPESRTQLAKSLARL